MRIGKGVLSLAVFCLLSAALTTAMCVADTIVPCTGGTENCPNGTSQLAKFEWNGSSYAPEGSANGISVSGNASGGTWVSTVKYVAYVIIKADGQCLTLSTNPPQFNEAGYQIGSFDNSNSGFINPQNGKPYDISNIKFCGDGTTAVVLRSFTARSNDEGKIVLAWKTDTEVDNAGFNLYRAATKGGPYTKINDARISAQGDSTNGASYQYEDVPPGNGRYFYLLEDVDANGGNTIHGPQRARLGE